MTAGDLLRHWAYDAKLSIKEVAARLNVTRVTISRYIHGHARPTGDQRTAIERMVAANPQHTCKAIPESAWAEAPTRPRAQPKRAA
jgi:transcriptional regulator with XRE-family HTH domain